MAQRAQWLVAAGVLTVLLTGCASIAHRPRTTTVLFDEAHGERFLVGEEGHLDLSHLGGVMRAAGLRVTSGREKLADGTLAGVDAFVISGPFGFVTPSEVDAVLRFLERGGRVAVMVHVGLPVAVLLDSLHVAISNGIIHERENVIGDEPLKFHVTRFAPHELTRDLTGFDAYGVWALMNKDDSSAIVARTSDSSWVDLNANQVLDEKDAVQSFAVAVAGTYGKGRFVVFGDDAIFQNRFLAGGNLALAKNLARWLAATGGVRCPTPMRNWIELFDGTSGRLTATIDSCRVLP